MQTLDMTGIIAFEGDRANLLARGIRAVTGSEFSHCWLHFGRACDIEVIFEANAYRTMPNSLNTYMGPNHYIEFYRPIYPMPVILSSLNHVYHDFDGVHYGYPQALGLGLVSLARDLGLQLDNPFKSGLVCSEIAYYYLLRLGLRGRLANVSPNNITPLQARDIVAGAPEFIKWGIKHYGTNKLQLC